MQTTMVSFRVPIQPLWCIFPHGMLHYYIKVGGGRIRGS